MLTNNPAPSAVFRDIRDAAASAESAWRVGFAAYVARHPDVSTAALRDQFNRTVGAELVEAAVTARRKFDAATVVADAIVIAGRTWAMSDLSIEARDQVHRAVIEHGPNTDAWPAAVRTDIAAHLNGGPRAATFGEFAEERQLSLMALRASVDGVLDEYGTNPSAWPNDAIDRVALAHLRADAFGQLVARSRALDVVWSARPITERAAKVDSGRAERERLQLLADITAQQTSLLAAIEGLAATIKSLRAERQIWVDMESAGQSKVAPESYAERDAEIAQRAEDLAAAQARFARWQSAPDEQKTATYNLITEQEH